MPHQSRFAVVIRHRAYLEREAQQEFVLAKNRLMEEEERLRRLRMELARALDSLTEGQTRGMSADEMGVYYLFVKRQGERIEDCQKAVDLLAGQCEEKRIQLTRAVQDRKVIEKVDEVRKEAFVKEAAKKEQNLLDEIGGRQHWKPPRRKIK